MKNKKKEYVLVNKKVTKFLKTPLPKKFIEPVSFKSKLIIFTLVFLGILIASVKQLGAETGIYFAICFSVFLVLVYMKSQRDLKVGPKILTKHDEEN